MLSTKITRSPRAGIVLVDSQALRLSQAIAEYQADQVTWLIAELAQKGFNGLTPTHVSFMSALDCADNFASELARRLNLSRQAVHKTVNELTARGYIETVPNKAKRNSKIIEITAHGETLIAVARQLYAELDKNLITDCTTRDVDRLIEVLKGQFSP